MRHSAIRACMREILKSTDQRCLQEVNIRWTSMKVNKYLVSIALDSQLIVAQIIFVMLHPAILNINPRLWVLRVYSFSFHIIYSFICLSSHSYGERFCAFCVCCKRLGEMYYIQTFSIIYCKLFVFFLVIS